MLDNDSIFILLPLADSTRYPILNIMVKDSHFHHNTTGAVHLHKLVSRNSGSYRSFKRVFKFIGHRAIRGLNLNQKWRSSNIYRWKHRERCALPIERVLFILVRAMSLSISMNESALPFNAARLTVF